MCDVMGHVNVRHYAAMFDDASFQLLGYLAGTGQETETGRGWADARFVMEYKRELSAGTLVTIRTQVTRIGRSSLTYRHEMSGTLDGALRAEAEVVTVRFDLSARAPTALEPEIRERAGALLRNHPEKASP
ncbi:acyl-CoA thioesterase [Rhodoligotrophos defluvii]|uniref:acyl-CoA thioesterase n=1 Tax=Rhodoligotrophos defluvii TaxID=2561934 RepID=UPI0010CA1245|nr:thioesterase family protein [Rhodoligotrophos defluvii]